MSTDMTTPESQADIRPIIATGRGGQLGLWAFGVLLALMGAWLFSVMSQRREAITAPRTTAAPTDPSQRIASPPPLEYAPAFDPVHDRLDESPEPDARSSGLAGRNPNSRSDPSPRFALPPITSPTQRYENLPSQPAVVFDSRNSPPPLGAATSAGQETSPSRVTAGRFANPARTIPQGTVIPAVLETALDSTRPGGVRALVQRDIHGFDGSRVLIQRGSRLYGEYDAELQSGEKRALIRWTRLIRPDGVTIALDSPASDPLGRAGVKGKVDSKFFQRFGGAILQSFLDIGVGVATREVTDGVIVALPGSTQNVTASANPSQVRPTLSVKHGTSVSVFVARDLDFSTVEP